MILNPALMKLLTLSGGNQPAVDMQGFPQQLPPVEGIQNSAHVWDRMKNNMAPEGVDPRSIERHTQNPSAPLRISTSREVPPSPNFGNQQPQMDLGPIGTGIPPQAPPQKEKGYLDKLFGDPQRMALLRYGTGVLGGEAPGTAMDAGMGTYRGMSAPGKAPDLVDIPMGNGKFMKARWMGQNYQDATIPGFPQGYKPVGGDARRFAPSESLADKKELAKYKHGLTGGATGLAKLNPKDFTPESWGAFQRSGYKDTSVLRQYEKPGTGTKYGKRTLPGGLEQEGYYDAKHQWVPTSKPYDPKLMTTDAADQQGKIAAGKRPGPDEVWRNEQIKLDVKAEHNRKVNQPNHYQALAQQERKTETVVRNIKKAREEMKSWRATGMPGALEGIMPWSSPNSRLSRYLDTIVANLGFDKLADMRKGSATGASGLGALSENEMRLLTAVQGALDPKDEAVLEENLKIIEDLYPVVMQEEVDLYNKLYPESKYARKRRKTDVPAPPPGFEVQ